MPADIEDLKKVEVACALSPWKIQGYAAEIVREDCAAFIARREDGEPVGFLIGRTPILPAGIGEVFNIGVVTDARRKGIGNALLAEFIEECRRRRAAEVWLEARASNQEAIDFYQANSFEPNGIRSNFYENPPEDAQMMTLKLGVG